MKPRPLPLTSARQDKAESLSLPLTAGEGSFGRATI